MAAKKNGMKCFAAPAILTVTRFAFSIGYNELYGGWFDEVMLWTSFFTYANGILKEFYWLLGLCKPKNKNVKVDCVKVDTSDKH